MSAKDMGSIKNLYFPIFTIFGLYFNFNRYYNISFEVPVPNYIRYLDDSAGTEKIGDFIIAKAQNSILPIRSRPCLIVTASLKNTDGMFNLVKRVIDFRKEINDSFKTLKPLHYHRISEPTKLISIRKKSP